MLAPAAVFRDRSFFGVTEVLRTETETILMHGTTVHGRRANPADPEGCMARTTRSPARSETSSGLGTRCPRAGSSSSAGSGPLPCTRALPDDLAFYEIDPLVARVAEDPSLFTYLQDRQPPAAVELGDGRLLVEESPTDSIGLLIMDAFSSDAPPGRLLTLEAIADADRAVTDDGMLVIHVSNRYYDLAPPVNGALDALGLHVLEREYAPTAAGLEAGAGLSHWVVGTRNPDIIEALRMAGWS